MFLVSNKALSLEILPGPYSWPKMYKRSRWWGGRGVRRRVVQKKTSVTRPSRAVFKKYLLFRHIELSKGRGQTMPKKSFADVLDM